MTARILVGTCSWTDKSLVDCRCFYPPEAKTPEARLRFYASRFPVVEVDSTYYGLPTDTRNAALWVERTPPEFVFDVKAFRLLTHHPTPPEALPRDMREGLGDLARQKRNLYYRDLPQPVRDDVWRRFAGALLPLDSAGKLGVVLFQFPPWFLPGSDSTAHILEARERLPQYRVAVEFRNNRWLSETNRARTIDFMRRHSIPLVCVDEPQGFASSVPPLSEATADVAVVRFHGRKRDTWERKGATTADRFDYLYTEDELREWVSPVERLAAATREVHVLMNNCVRDKAVVNAGQMRMLLGA
ncbi:MAG TPA: DUF72 domain-containing protein [Dehalococcoidia bacterium]|nr:DUF72 domain-containing protein [Dehalococcoidia bacterium]